jgi:hypothetical protein
MIALFRRLSHTRRAGISIDFFLVAAIVAVTCLSAMRAVAIR